MKPQHWRLFVAFSLLHIEVLLSQHDGETLAAEAAWASSGPCNVRVVDDWSPQREGRACLRPGSHGCLNGSVWIREPCIGLFNLSGKATLCGDRPGEEVQWCDAGATRTPASSCGLMILTSYFTLKPDWQTGRMVPQQFGYIRHLYRSVMLNGLNATVIFDSLPEDLIGFFANDRVRFLQVRLDDWDYTLGVNDIRFLVFQDEIKKHPEWQTIFMVDAFDVQAATNPCSHMTRFAVEPSLLYVGSENKTIRGNEWFFWVLSQLGGQYRKWYSTVKREQVILNAGISGGSRAVVLEFLEKLSDVLMDPELTVRKMRKQVNANMAAFNYVVYNNFSGRFRTGSPVHSRFKRFEDRRTDVWFVHK